MLWQAVDPDFEGERPSTIRLAADIYLTRPIELGAYQYNVIIEGGDRYSIAHADGYTGPGYLFGIAPDTTRNITFVGITFKVSGQLQSIFGGDNGGTVREFALYDCFTRNVNFAYTTKVFDSTINARGCDINAPAAFGLFSLGAATFGGTITYDTPTLGGSAAFAQKSTFGDIFYRGVSGVVCGSGATDISLTVDGGVKITPSTLTLTGSSPNIPVGNESFIILSDGGTSGHATISNGKGTGHILLLSFTGGTGSHGYQIHKRHSGSNIKLHSNFHPSDDDTLLLVWANGAWLEISRSHN